MEGPFHILVADASARNRNLLRSFLSAELNYQVLEASSAREVQKIADEADPDLILLDSRLPELDGYDLVKRLKSEPRTRMIPILVMTSLDEKDRRVFVVESGADEMLLKPLDKLELLVRVKSLVRLKFFHDELLREREKIQKMKEDFLAMITHDLKTPLTVIIGNTGLLLYHLRSRDLPVKEVTAIDIASRNLLLLVNNLLNVMRMDSGMMTFTPESFPLGRLAGEVVSMLSPLANQKGIQLKLNSEREFWVQADPEKIRQVISNLISNAIKFTPGGGTVSLNLEAETDRIRVAVSDTGPGISGEDSRRLFQKFSQKKGEKGGTGLGLYIVKKMLELHGSSIALESKVGQGTTFSFVLPSGKPLGAG